MAITCNDYRPSGREGPGDQYQPVSTLAGTHSCGTDGHCLPACLPASFHCTLCSRPGSSSTTVLLVECKYPVRDILLST